MKEDVNKPLYKDYKKQKGYRIWGTAVSGERSYEHADRPLIIIGWVLILFAVGVIGWLNPYSRYYTFETVIICLVLFYLAVSFYERKFLYRFGRFGVTWDNPLEHPDENASEKCERYGKFLKTEENRKAARKTRRAFLVLFTGIIAAVLLYCFLWIGLSYTRVYTWHSGEIEEAKRIAQNYDAVLVSWWSGADGIKEDKVDMNEQDRRRLWEIFHSLNWEYVYELYVSSKNGYIQIAIHTPFGYSRLEWYEDIVDISYAKGIADTATQLDEHWFYIRMDDGRAF